ncbi:MAG: thiol reductant ABC exporter subunit CydC [Bifidobacteriaceae bacterium]|jgi:ATP-binding cassette subfamily C protein CydC|nr:thiol reductant ABC exporter subunit CydC [Bifidobacteriaceae bacterium]
MNASITSDPLWRAVTLTGLSAGPMVKAVAAGAMTLVSSVGLAAASAWLIVRSAQSPPVLTLEVCVVLVRLFGITRGGFRYLERLAAHRVALNGMTELRVRLYDKLAGGKVAATALLRRGDLLARVGADVEDVGDLVVRGIVPALVAAVLVGLSAAFITIFVPLAGIAVLVCLLTAGILAPLLTIRSARLAEFRGAASRSRVTAATMTLLEYGDELAVGGRLGDSAAELKAAEHDLFRALDDAAKPSALAVAVNEAIIGLAVVACFVFGTMAMNAGTISPEVLAVVVLTPLACFEAVAGLPAAATQMYRSRAAATRICDLLDKAGTSPTEAARRQGDGPEPASLPADATLRLVDGSCGWVPGEPVLTHVNLTLRPGRSLAIVGPSGAGKTTLLATLAGLLEPLEGRVEIGGVALDTLTRSQAAETVAFVAEDAHIFATTVLENLRVANGRTTRADALRALESTGLTPWLDGLPDGLDTMLGPGGSTVSGGERRRLLLARALLSPARFLLLDEPGEHLDADSADRLTALICGLAASTGKGVAIVTHRLGVLDQIDEEMMVDDRYLAACNNQSRLAAIADAAHAGS